MIVVCDGMVDWDCGVCSGSFLVRNLKLHLDHPVLKPVSFRGDTGALGIADVKLLQRKFFVPEACEQASLQNCNKRHRTSCGT